MIRKGDHETASTVHSLEQLNPPVKWSYRMLILWWALVAYRVDLEGAIAKTELPAFGEGSNLERRNVKTSQRRNIGEGLDRQ
jgi:hypothetical protein